MNCGHPGYLVFFLAKWTLQSVKTVVQSLEVITSSGECVDVAGLMAALVVGCGAWLSVLAPAPLFLNSNEKNK